jgi:DNA helicase-2/ATP-dependent DNA helicase PcrA
VRNILDFPARFPGTTVIKLEQNFRSTRPILDATNAVMSASRDRYKKDLWTAREGGERPRLVTCGDEVEQAEYVVRGILARREAGTDLRQQAVLFRASHHSIVLEAELARRGVPFVKYGGLKFIEAAHVKDLMAFLRFAENPRDVVAGTRLLLLLPGIGAKKARDLLAALAAAGGDLAVWRKAAVPKDARALWTRLVTLLAGLARAGETPVAAQVHRVRRFYAPLAEQRYDNVEPRLRDLEQLEQIAQRYADRGAMLADITLDPPTSTEDLAGPPHLDDDYLILSTIHSAKGLEWDAVCVIHASDGNIPSDMATGSTEQIEEERRLFYVALTRARRTLEVLFPLRYYVVSRGAWSDDHVYGQLTRFLTPGVKKLFEHVAARAAGAADRSAAGAPDPDSGAARARLHDRLRSRWS